MRIDPNQFSITGDERKIDAYEQTGALRTKNAVYAVAVLAVTSLAALLFSASPLLTVMATVVFVVSQAMLLFMAVTNIITGWT